MKFLASTFLKVLLKCQSSQTFRDRSENPQQLRLLFHHAITPQNESSCCYHHRGITCLHFRLRRSLCFSHFPSVLVYFLPCCPVHVLSKLQPQHLDPPLLAQVMITWHHGFVTHLCCMRFVKHTFFKKLRLTFMK